MNLSRGSTSNVITNPLANYFLVGPFFKLMPFKLSFFKMAVARPVARPHLGISLNRIAHMGDYVLRLR